MMATAEPTSAPHDRITRRRPFQWMRRLANLKSSTSPNRQDKKHHANGFHRNKNHGEPSKHNNPYPESGHLRKTGPAPTSANGRLSFGTPHSDNASTYSSVYSGGPHGGLMRSNKSTAPTLATNAETIHSDAGASKAGTANTVGGGQSSHDGGANSTFSSPNHSERSLTTTLTTIQSTAPSAFLSTAHAANHPTNAGAHATTLPGLAQTGSSSNGNQASTSPYPSSPASAVPPHVHQGAQLHPHTYSAATANNILTDDASILTLASSSKRRRRHSLDTNASVRALAPSSLWGGSRESLPLSVLSASNDVPQRPPVVPGAGIASAERASVYGASGVAAPALSSERNSFYADRTKSISSVAGIAGGATAASSLRGFEGGGGTGGVGGAGTTDAASVRSGLLGHGRGDSVSGSIGSPLASPREPSGGAGAGGASNGKLSRKGSGWTKGEEDDDAVRTADGVVDGGGAERDGSRTELAIEGAPATTEQHDGLDGAAS